MAGGICDLATRMPSSHQQTISHAISAESWPQGRIDLAAGFILLFSLIARVWAASGTFLNPDEALHFRLANQTSWAARLPTEPHRFASAASDFHSVFLARSRNLGTLAAHAFHPGGCSFLLDVLQVAQECRRRSRRPDRSYFCFVPSAGRTALSGNPAVRFAFGVSRKRAVFSGRFFCEELIGQNDCIFPVPLPGDVVALLRLLVRRGPRHLCVYCDSSPSDFPRH